ncbi:MAG TPA: NAD(P)H-dependent oxidoreductase [Bryobacteraceae bacterium]|nr:NAD(P)H-dependent oxidoreductase [Bryobacteraceae bacterium]
MHALLHIDSSPMGERSISRNLTWEFVNQWRAVNPEGWVIRRDLAAITIPVVDAAWIAANYTQKESRTSAQHETLALSSLLTQELLDADEYVIGVPMHNWGPAASFRLWMDQVVRFGETVAVTPTGTEGTLNGKRLTCVLTAGRHYGPDTENAGRNHLEPWLRTFFGNLGVRYMRFIFVDGTVEVIRGRIAQADFLAPHLAAIGARPSL